MKIYVHERGSNQYIKVKKTETFKPLLAFVLGGTLLFFMFKSVDVEKGMKFLEGVTFGTFPPVAFAAKLDIKGTVEEEKQPTVENVVAEIARVFGPEGKTVVKQALDVSMCESGWRADAYNFNTNKTGDYNIFQINSLWVKVYGDLFMHNWIENIRVAHEIYVRNHSFGPWVCAKKLGIVK